MEDVTLQQAIRDLEIIRRAIERVEHPGATAPVPRPVWDTNMILQGAALIGSTFFLIQEMLSGGMHTIVLLASKDFPDLRVGGLSFIGGVLILAVFAIYWFVRLGAMRSDESFNDHVARHFVYVRNMSFASDLFMKFAMFSALVIAGRPDWCAPALLLFTGDYLFQGRLFTLPIKTSLVLGALCFAIGITQAAVGSPSLMYPLAVFSLVCACSLARLAAQPRSTPATRGASESTEAV